MKRTCFLVAAAFILLTGEARADIVYTYVGTQDNSSNWLITGAGAVQAPAFFYGGQQQEISITNNGGETGTFVTGGSLANFNGFWMASEQFSLPANATGVSLTFSNMNADDRAVLELNGTIIGNFALVGAGPNLFSFPPGPPDQNYSFTNTTSGTVNSGFVLAGENTLTLVVNNVDGGYFGPTSTFTSTSDGTHAGFDATVSYTAVPEPSSLVLGSIAMSGMAASAWRRRRLTEV